VTRRINMDVYEQPFALTTSYDYLKQFYVLDVENNDQNTEQNGLIFPKENENVTLTSKVNS